MKIWFLAWSSFLINESCFGASSNPSTPLELKEQVVYREAAHRNGQLFHHGKLLMDITNLSKMPYLIVDIRSRVRLFNPRS
jgi:hypothetical protein